MKTKNNRNIALSQDAILHQLHCFSTSIKNQNLALEGYMDQAIIIHVGKTDNFSN